MSQVDEIHLIHHCHTDVGYTHDQPTLWDLQRRFIETAIDAAAADADEDGPHTFKWTVETTAPLLRWLATADPERVAEFRALEAQGRIEVTGMLANVTPLYDHAQLVESLRPVAYLREEYGFDVRHAMNCDVNGHNWPLVDLLDEAGIEGFTMAINTHFGGAPPNRPGVFRWEGPSGRDVLAYNGHHYSAGWAVGIGHDAEALREEWWPRLDAHLDAVDYPLSTLMLQSFHPFGDNGPAYPEFTAFVADWNAQDAVADGDLPRLRIATPSQWWDAVREEADDLPVMRGDWTDFWNFGAISSAREVAINRENRRRLRTADALEAALGSMGRERASRPPARRAPDETRAEAWWALNAFDEHTWGADGSVWDADGEDTASQWHHKAGYAYDARSHSQLLRRDAVAAMARQVADQGVAADE